MDTAFVTGATGFLGLNLVEQLAGRGWQVVALHRPTSNLTWLKRFGPRLAEGDITHPASLEAAMPEGVTAVFHAAADTSVWSGHNARQTRVNVDGTRNVVETALRKGARRFIHVSTWNTFDLDRPVIDEDSPQIAGSSWINYNRTKYLAEQEVRGAVPRGLDPVILSPSHMVGRYDTHNWGRFFFMVAENRLPGVPPGSASFCHAEKVAAAAVAAVERGGTGENYLFGGADAGYAEFVGIIGELLRRKVPKRPVPAWVLRPAAAAMAATAKVTGREPPATPEGVAIVACDRHIRSDKAGRVLGYQPSSLRTMLEDAHGWLTAEALL